MDAHFVLDHNFPGAVAKEHWQNYLPDGLRLTRLYDLDPDLSRDHEDWQILLKLDRRGDVDGFITNDYRITRSATEMVAMAQTALALVVTVKSGHHPVRAMGLVMVHLIEIANGLDGTPRIHLLKPSGRAEHPNQRINRIAQCRRTAPDTLVAAEMASIRDYLAVIGRSPPRRRRLR